MKNFGFVLLFFFLSSNSFAQDATPSLDELASQFRAIMKEEQATFVVTTAGALFSYDPLKADYARNIDAMRLLYATPLEMNENGALSSTVLENFKFDAQTNKITFILRSDVHYEDGSLMTIEDLGLAIKRMMIGHEIFPVIREIVGIKEWLKQKYPLKSLPKGMVIDETKRSLEIQLGGRVTEPLFRFSLELFSIIPSRCVDMEKSTLICPVPPFSGRYRLGNNLITKVGKKAFYPVFVKFESRSNSSDYPKDMWLAFMSPARIVEYAADFNNFTVIKANEIDIPNFQRQILTEKMKVYSGPKLLYSVITLNPKSKTFATKRVRQYFAMKFREGVREYGLEPQGSIFTALLIGYLPLKDLQKRIPSFSKKEEIEIIKHLKKYPPVFIKDAATGLHPFTYIFSSVLKKLEIPELEPIVKGEYADLWERGVLALRPASSGFWPMDPTGDIRMVFTPGMHAFVVQEPKISKLVADLRDGDKNSHESLNRFMFEDSKMAITTNYSRIYFVAKNSPIFMPYGISAPQSWSFFKKSK